MIVNKLIIILCIIFLILLLRKLSYENFYQNNSNSNGIEEVKKDIAKKSGFLAGAASIAGAYSALGKENNLPDFKNHNIDGISEESYDIATSLGIDAGSKAAQFYEDSIQKCSAESAPPILLNGENVNYDCNNIKEEVCKFLETANICKYTNSGCKHSCKFDINNQDFLDDIKKLDNNSQKFQRCLDRCDIQTENSYCTKQDCLNICNNLNLEKKGDIIRYSERSKEDNSDRHYEDLVKRITSLDNNDILMKKILNPLQQYTNLQSSPEKEAELKQKIENLNRASSILSDLNDTNLDINNDMSQRLINHLENLLKKKRSLNENKEYNIQATMIHEKINRIKELTNYFSEQGLKGKDSKKINKMHGVFKSIKCLANGQTLNIEPVIQSIDDGKSGSNLFVDRIREYLIQVNGEILFYELRNIGNTDVTLDDNRTISKGQVCRGELNDDANKHCKYVPTNGYFKLDNGEIKNNNFNTVGEFVDPKEWDTIKNDRQFKGVMHDYGAYFFVNKISNNTEYNDVLKRAGNLNYESNLIKYPFYLVQPSAHSDKCVNLKKTKTGTNIITIEKCSNKPTERFDAFVYSSYNPNCK